MIRRSMVVNWTVMVTLAAIGVEEARRRLPGGGGQDGPRRLRRMLERLGPTFTKLGQLVAGRRELLPERYRTELSGLRDHVTPLPSSVVRQVIEQAYGQRLEDVFAEFSLEPFAAASIGQVHFGTLADGRDVAVKVRRPEAARQIEADLAALAVAAAGLHRLVPKVRHLGLPALVEEFSQSLRDEVDYELEATHSEEVRRQLAALPWVFVPAMILPLCRPDVLVMELVEGVALTDGPGIDLAGLDRRRLGGQIITANLWLILSSDVFHADPHAGNYRVTPDGRLGMLDFGQVGHSTPAMRSALFQLLTAIVSGDGAGTAAAVAMICGTEPEDVEALGGAMADLVAGVVSVPLGEVRLAAVLHDLLAALAQQHMSMPIEMTMLIKAVLECESTAEEVFPGLGLAEVLPFAVGLSGPQFGSEPAESTAEGAGSTPAEAGLLAPVGSVPDVAG
jgi:ubiquinone biosynthesis protein